MGVKFYEHVKGRHLFNCVCKTNLSNRNQLISTGFRGMSGQALLFKRVVNVIHGNVEIREMITGRHFVRDVFCKGCERKLGWYYEFATNKDQAYKEGKTILERAFLVEVE